MDRKQRYGIASFVVFGVAIAVYLSPAVRARENLPHLWASQVFSRAHHALAHTPFTETLSYQQSLLPPEVNAARPLNFPVPDAQVNTVVLYQASPSAWRLQELNRNNTVVGVVARHSRHLVTYQSDNNHRTEESLPAGLTSGWNLWPIPTRLSWRQNWNASVSTGRFFGMGGYEVTLTPKHPGTLWGAVTYWFDGVNFLPLGVRVTGRHAGTVMQVTADSIAVGSPGSAVDPPSAGRVVAWKASSSVFSAARPIITANGETKLTFPARLGRLERISERQAGDNAVSVYGVGPGRVVVLDTTARIFKRQPGLGFFRPIQASPGYQGVTDGIFSVVTFHQNSREITLMSSRPQKVLAEWAKAAWH